MSLDSTTVTMNTVVGSLKNLHSMALHKVNDTWEAADGLQGQALNQLEFYANQIDRLDGELRTKVLSAELSFEKWANIAQSTDAGIRYTAGLAGSWSLGSVVSDTIDASLEDLKEKVVIPGAAGAGVTLVLVAIIAVVVLVLRVR